MSRHPGAVDIFGLFDALLATILKPPREVLTLDHIWEVIKTKYPDYTPTSWSKHFYELKRNGYVTATDGSIEFTVKAKMRAMESKIKERGVLPKYRFLSFDIPERYRKKRDAFRRAIKRVGFKQIQRSLWVCNKDVADYIELLAYEYGVEKFIAYIISEQSDIDGLIDKIFITGHDNARRDA